MAAAVAGSAPYRRCRVAPPAVSVFFLHFLSYGPPAPVAHGLFPCPAGARARTVAYAHRWHAKPPRRYPATATPTIPTRHPNGRGAAATAHRRPAPPAGVTNVPQPASGRDPPPPPASWRGGPPASGTGPLRSRGRCGYGSAAGRRRGQAQGWRPARRPGNVALDDFSLPAAGRRSGTSVRRCASPAFLPAQLHWEGDEQRRDDAQTLSLGLGPSVRPRRIPWTTSTEDRWYPFRCFGTGNDYGQELPKPDGAPTFRQLERGPRGRTDGPGRRDVTVTAVSAACIMHGGGGPAWGATPYPPP